MRKELLGSDIGGVIIQRARGETPPSLDVTDWNEVEGGTDALAALARFRFGCDGVHLISRCSVEHEPLINRWLRQEFFFERTGIDPHNVHFCRERHQKADICGKLGITHMVDDRLEVLSHLGMVPNRFLFQARPAENEPFAGHLSQVTPVDSWLEVRELLLP